MIDVAVFDLQDNTSEGCYVHGRSEKGELIVFDWRIVAEVMVTARTYFLGFDHFTRPLGSVTISVHPPAPDCHWKVIGRCGYDYVGFAVINGLFGYGIVYGFVCAPGT
jgi:hypothetical protein